MNRFKSKALRVIADFLSTKECEDIKDMFKKMDDDDDGIVSIEELKVGLKNFGSQLADSEVEMLIEADGRISYDEFVAMMRTGTDWRKASRNYSRGRFNSLSMKLVKHGSINLGNEETKVSAHNSFSIQ